MTTTDGTPGLYYAFAYALYSALVMLLLNKDRKWKKEIPGTILMTFLISWIIIVTDGYQTISQALYVPISGFIVLVRFFYLKFACERSWMETWYYTAWAIMLSECCAAIQWQLYYFFVDGNVKVQTLLTQILMLLVIHGILLLICYVAGREILYKWEQPEIRLHEVFSTGFIVLLVHLASNISCFWSNTPLSAATSREFFLLRMVINLCGVAALYVIHMRMMDEKWRYEVQILEKTLQFQKDNYQTMENSTNLVNQKYHDLKHYLNVLKSEAGEETVRQRLLEMENEIKIYEAQNKTGNKVLDTILTAKSIECQSKKIQMNCIADGKILSCMDPFDISILIGNALDNAVEAVMKFQDPDKRLIYITIEQVKHFVRIRIENTVAEVPAFDHGIPLTTKKDKENHGFGMKSMETIVNKYDGSIMGKVNGEWFELQLLLQMQERMSVN